MRSSAQRGPLRLAALAVMATALSAGCVYRYKIIREPAAAEFEIASRSGAARYADASLAAMADSEQFILHSDIMNEAFLIQVDPMALNARRNRDLVDIASKQQGQTFGPGGAAMEGFLNEELRPVIEARYPVDPARSVLAGHSLGGLFTASVMAKDPNAFAGCMIGSPSLRFDPGLVERVRKTAKDGRGRVFIGVGAEEGSPAARAQMIRGADALEEALKSPGSGFATARKAFAGETRVSVQGAWMSAGLRRALAPKEAGDRP